MKKPLLAALCVLLAGVGVAPVHGQNEAPAQEPRVVDFPPGDVGVATLDQRKAAQMATKDQFDVPIDFSFTDKLPESGITFVHGVPDDARLFYKPVHYDHGSPVALSDVDGDGLLDIYFVSLVDGNELWRNKGDGTFEDWTAKSGTGLADRTNMAASFADYDNDGDPDLFVTGVRTGNVLFQNDGKGTFRDVTKQAGLEYSGHSSTGVFFDYDGDGHLDLLLTNVGVYTKDEKDSTGAYLGVDSAFEGHLRPERSEASILYHNEGDGTFQDVTKQAGVVDLGWNGDASITDLNRDGRPDFYLLNMQGDDSYYVNVDGTKFVNKVDEVFPKNPWGAMGVKFFDYDLDGRLDLLLTDMHSDMSKRVGPDKEKLKAEVQYPEESLQGGDDNIFGNALWHNEGDGKMSEVSDSMGVENYWPWGPSVGDLNADGYDDVFIASSMSYPFRYGINTLLINNRGKKFLDSEFILGVEPRRDGRTHIPWFDLDCQNERHQWHALCQAGGTGQYEVRSPLGTRGVVIADLDNDGDLDIVTNEFGAEPQILISDFAQKHDPKWLKVVLQGTRSNRDGIGAWVTVEAGDQSYVRYMDGQEGYLSHGTIPLYFGLGNASKVDRVKVRWPSGAEQTVTDGLGVGRTVTVVEPEGESGGEMEEEKETEMKKGEGEMEEG